MPIGDFREAPASGPLPEHTVHVWWAGPGDAHHGLVRLLDPVELARYRATASPAARRQFLLGCAISRVALGTYLAMAPDRVPLVRQCPVCGGPHGKVRLRGPGPARPGAQDDPGEPGAPDAKNAGHLRDLHGAGDPSGGRDGEPGGGGTGPIGFSVTHSGGLVGVAFHRGGEVGLDAEAVDPALRVPEIAPGVLSPRELAELDRVPPAGRLRAFLRYWCRKEAAAKAVGVGLRTRFRALEVTPPGRPAAVTRWPDRPAAARTLRLTDLDVDDAHRTCLAVLSPSPVTVEQYRAGALLRRWAGR